MKGEENTGETTAPKVGEAEMQGVLEEGLGRGCCGENHGILDWSDGPWRLGGTSRELRLWGTQGRGTPLSRNPTRS